jgi:hypothetical protein
MTFQRDVTVRREVFGVHNDHLVGFALINSGAAMPTPALAPTPGLRHWRLWRHGGRQGRRGSLWRRRPGMSNAAATVVALGYRSASPDFP